MKKHLRTIEKTDCWITPRYITKPLGMFDLDPCVDVDMPWYHAGVNYTINDDGLSKEWFGRVWLNPPFNSIGVNSWFRKMSEHNNGIMLCGFSGETTRFKRYVYGKCSGLLIMDHRPRFCHSSGIVGKGNCGQTICLIAYGEDNLVSLMNSGLGTVFIEKGPDKGV